jgi:L-rhamnose isomerase/sugar isomerase
MIQTVTTAQELYAKAAIVDHKTLAAHQQTNALVDAETCLKDAFATDIRPIIEDWRKAHNLPPNPLAAYRKSGYHEHIEAERKAKNRTPASSYA